MDIAVFDLQTGTKVKFWFLTIHKTGPCRIQTFTAPFLSFQTTTLHFSTFFDEFATSSMRPTTIVPKSSAHTSAFGSMSAEFVSLPTTTASKWSASIGYETSSPISSELSQDDFPNWPIYVGLGVLGLLILLVAAILLWVNIRFFIY